MNDRMFSAVMFNMIAFLPQDKEDFKEDLLTHIRNNYYASPEDSSEWLKAKETIMRHLPISQITEDWQFKLLAVFTIKPIEVLRTELKMFK